MLSCRIPALYYWNFIVRACANRRATFRTWHLSEGLNSLLTTAWHIRYSPIGAASKSLLRYWIKALPLTLRQSVHVQPSQRSHTARALSLQSLQLMEGLVKELGEVALG